MNNILIFLFIPFLIASEFSISETDDVFCNFEEVYSNSQTQQGFLMIKKNKVRYEYKKHNLYTIFVNEDQFTLVQNFDKDTKHLIKPSDELFEIAIDLMKKYPAKLQDYKNYNYEIQFEKSKKFDFYKRISIKSINYNLSIFFFDCSNSKIEDKYFNLDPIIEIRS